MNENVDSVWPGYYNAVKSPRQFQGGAKVTRFSVTTRAIDDNKTRDWHWIKINPIFILPGLLFAIYDHGVTL